MEPGRQPAPIVNLTTLALVFMPLGIMSVAVGLMAPGAPAREPIEEGPIQLALAPQEEIHGRLMSDASELLEWHRLSEGRAIARGTITIPIYGGAVGKVSLNERRAVKPGLLIASGVVLFIVGALMWFLTRPVRNERNAAPPGY